MQKRGESPLCYAKQQQRASAEAQKEKNRNGFYRYSKSVFGAAVNSHVRLIMKEAGMLIKPTLKLYQPQEALTNHRDHSGPC